MRNYVTCYLLWFSFLSGYTKAQTDKKYINQAIVVKSMMEKYHYSPQVFDDDFSTKIFDDFITSLDRYHLFFTQADIGRLSAYREKIDDELNTKSTAFLKLTTQLFKSRLLKSDSIIAQFLQKPFDFSVKETLLYPPDSSSFANDEKEFENKWNKWLKFEVLYRLIDKKLADSTLTTTEVMKQEASVREITKKIEQRRIKRILDYSSGYDAYVAMLFCNAITSCYDPHSAFIPLTVRENFEGDVNAHPYSFGLELAENEKGDVVISHIIPGSPAWRNGELNKDDVMVQIKWQNKNPVDMEEIAEQSYDNMEAYLLAQDKANEKLKEAGERLDLSEKQFAANHNVTLIDTKSELSQKAEKVSKVNAYYHDIYLIFFKSYKQEVYLVKSLGEKDINAIEQNKNSLEQVSAEGLSRLDAMKSFMGDASLNISCKKLLQFCQKESKEKVPVLTDFILKNEQLDKMKKTFDSKKESQRTKTDTDNFNKADNEFNAAVNNYNKVNKELNDARNKVINDWNNAVTSFMDRHMPYSK